MTNAACVVLEKRQITSENITNCDIQKVYKYINLWKNSHHGMIEKFDDPEDFKQFVIEEFYKSLSKKEFFGDDNGLKNYIFKICFFLYRKIEWSHARANKHGFLRYQPTSSVKYLPTQNHEMDNIALNAINSNNIDNINSISQALIDKDMEKHSRKQLDEYDYENLKEKNMNSARINLNEDKIIDTENEVQNFINCSSLINIIKYDDSLDNNLKNNMLEFFTEQMYRKNFNFILLVKDIFDNLQSETLFISFEDNYCGFEYRENTYSITIKNLFLSFIKLLDETKLEKTLDKQYISNNLRKLLVKNETKIVRNKKINENTEKQIIKKLNKDAVDEAIHLMKENIWQFHLNI